MKYAIISNNCTGEKIYGALLGQDSHFIEYTTPFVASLFLDDTQYIKLCENYTYYTSIFPTLGLARESRWEKSNGNLRYNNDQNQNYLILHLNDIDVHFIHDNNGLLLMKKYQGRLEASKYCEPLFVFSLSHLMCIYTEKEIDNMVGKFMALPYKSIMLSPYKKHAFDNGRNICRYIDQWEGYSLLEEARYSSGTKKSLLQWAEAYSVIGIFVDLIKERYGLE